MDNLKASLIIYNNPLYISLAKNFVESFIELLKIDKTFSNKIILITEEALVHTINHSYEPDETGEIIITTYIENYKLTLCFYDKGIPYAPEETKPFKPLKKEIQDDSLRIFLIEKIADKVEWLNHGKKGKELKISFNLPVKDITELIDISQEKLFSSEKNIDLAPPQKYDIHRIRDNEYLQVAKCIYRAYGYSYPNEDLYYPEKIKQLNQSGKLIGVVATDEKDNVVGHYALERYDLGDIAETGQAIVVPEHRNRKLMVKMRNKLEEIAKQIGLKGLYSQPVTSYTMSQKVNIKFGSKPFGILLGLVPKTLHFKRLKKEPLSQRESCMYYFKPLIFPYKKRIFVSEKYANIVKFIYTNGKFPEPEILNSNEIVEEHGEVITNYFPGWDFGKITVKKVGKDSFNLIKKGFLFLTMKTSAEVIYIDLPLEQEGCDILMDKLFDIGFIFSCISPFELNGNDIFKMQFLINDLDIELLNIEGNDAKKIFNFIKEEYNWQNFENIKI